VLAPDRIIHGDLAAAEAPDRAAIRGRGLVTPQQARARKAINSRDYRQRFKDKRMVVHIEIDRGKSEKAMVISGIPPSEAETPASKKAQGEYVWERWVYDTLGTSSPVTRPATAPPPHARDEQTSTPPSPRKLLRST
jgi:hypothetical protein